MTSMQKMTQLEATQLVAQELRDLAHAIRKENAYALHVTDTQKEAILAHSLAQADGLAAGQLDGIISWIDNFTLAQRVHYKMTGECVPLLGKAV
jgi:3-methyladenine DNA glycosylase AlkD